MKTYIFFTLVMCISFGAHSQSSSMSSWSRSFTADTPTVAELNAYEQRGAQKLKDFFDYAAIINNKSYDTAMRNKAAGQAVSLFTSENCTVSFNAKKEPVKAFINTLKTNKSLVLNPATDISVKTHFQPRFDDSYTATLSFSTTCNGQKCDKTITIVLKKVEKRFGSTKQLIWTVFLGDMG